MLDVFAEFGRAMIVQRVRTGIARARAEGTRSGKDSGSPKVQRRRSPLYGLRSSPDTAFGKVAQAVNRALTTPAHIPALQCGGPYGEA
jgi:DNA invertase Pin-like site-specific DNA recombinase